MAGSLAYWEQQFQQFVGQQEMMAAHDEGHLLRVVATARKLGGEEQADLKIVIPAAWLHDCYAVSKGDPLRSTASRLSAEKAAAFLREAGYPQALIEPIAHAIESHSFTAGITPQSLEAEVVQDADRLDALGAIGIARALIVGADLGRPLYDLEEPFPVERAPDDRVSTIDHFFTKLFKLAGQMRTKSGRLEAERRSEVMRGFLQKLAIEIDAQSVFTVSLRQNGLESVNL